MITKDMIDLALDRISFKTGDNVKVIDCTCEKLGYAHGQFERCRKGQMGTASYIYYNGFVLVDFGSPIEGGIFNNKSTYRVKSLTKA